LISSISFAIYTIITSTERKIPGHILYGELLDLIESTMENVGIAAEKSGDNDIAPPGIAPPGIAPDEPDSAPAVVTISLNEIVSVVSPMLST
jgi:hypothetical protein